MPRVLKTLSAEHEVTALWWGKLGLSVGDMSGFVYLWPTDDAPTGGLCHLGEQRRYLPHSLAVSSLCDLGPLLISCSLDGSISRWDSRSDTFGRIGERISDPVRVYPLDFNASVVIGTASGDIFFYSMDSDSMTKMIHLFESSVISFALHPTARQIFVLGVTELVLFGLDNNSIVNQVTVSVDCCTCCSVTLDGLSCAVSTTEGTVRIVDVVSFTEVGSIVFDQAELNAVARFNYGKSFVVTSTDGRVGVFDVRKMIKEKGLKVGRWPLLALAVNETIGKAAVAGCDPTVTLLDFE
jgi:WD40 repeat protein